MDLSEVTAPAAATQTAAEREQRLMTAYTAAPLIPAT
jgi:hypothetical protein